ncbi:MAG: hypothetical protein A2007_05760 [Verrucomicrobia bacterium GWC2_42_7]|nr:MAG: hypothetical protein A2007_05760 [Verrucomicrobia bacterium GWC2_42_7]
MNKAIFLDRDGTLIKHVPYLSKPEDVALCPGTIEFAKEALAQGFLLFLFTNQSGIGRGYFTLADVESCNQRMVELIGLGDIFKETCIAPEAPEEESLYRKPSPRFIQEMLSKYNISPSESWMLGDSPLDLQAGINAKINSGYIYGDVNPIPPDISALCKTHSIPQFETLADFFGGTAFGRPKAFPQAPSEKEVIARK